MAGANGPAVPEAAAPALRLGAALGELALGGRDKVTYVVSPSLASFPSWAEQLIAESTGKDGGGIIPVAGEPVGSPDVYGADRVFLTMRLAGEGDGADDGTAALLDAGHPVLSIDIGERADLGAEMYRAEFAVAAAGSALGINPFDQPDVEMAKVLARRAMEGEALGEGTVDEVTPAGFVRTAAGWLGTIGQGDYLAIQAYVHPTPAVERHLQSLRLGIRDRYGIATTLGYGPRFLHSTGQLHKGGPDAGLFPPDRG